MPYQDFRQFLDVLRQHGELIDVDRPVALSDVGKAMKQSYRRQGPGMMFNNNGTGFPLVAGVYSTRSKALLAFEADEKTILQKVLSNAVYDLFIGKDKLYTLDAAVDTAGVDTEIATMIEKGVLPPGTTILPRAYMLPRELGGLYR
jgi:UbiD family decarboxylase